MTAGTWKAIACVAFVLIACAAFSETLDAKYFCTAESSDGLAYDAALQQWVGTAFKPTHKFVLRLKLVRTRTPTGTERSRIIGDTIGDYEVAITDAGEKVAIPCWSNAAFKAGDGTVPIDGRRWLFCETSVGNYQLNLNNNRYLEVYPIGYADGQENNDNTPYVEGGTCTKID